MKELKGLRVKFIVSNMVMVSLVIGLAFFLVGGMMKLRVKQNQERLLGQAAEAEFRLVWRTGGA